MLYAQIDETGRVHTVCELVGEVDNPKLVPILEFNEAYIGSYFENGKFIHIKSTVDKQVIIADGKDTAIVSVEVPSAVTEIIFYNADTNEPIATVPVDPATHTATLQVTATTPGVIKIRAGEPTITRLNEVVIIAQ